MPGWEELACAGGVEGRSAMVIVNLTPMRKPDLLCGHATAITWFGSVAFKHRELSRWAVGGLAANDWITRCSVAYGTAIDHSKGVSRGANNFRGSNLFGWIFIGCH